MIISGTYSQLPKFLLGGFYSTDFAWIRYPKAARWDTRFEYRVLEPQDLTATGGKGLNELQHG